MIRHCRWQEPYHPEFNPHPRTFHLVYARMAGTSVWLLVSMTEEV